MLAAVERGEEPPEWPRPVQMPLLCNHQYKGHTCVRLPGHYSSHSDGDLSWTVDVKWPPLRRGRKVGG